MSRRLEIRTRMSELHKEYANLKEELDNIDNSAKLEANRLKYQDYKFKVGTYGYSIEAEDKVQDAVDVDREGATTGKSGLVYSGFDGHSEYGYVMLKERSDYPRAKRVLQIIDAVEHLASDKVQDKEKYIKIVLGEEQPDETVSESNHECDHD